MRVRIRIANGLVGGALSIYGNTDLGKPKRIQMRNARDLYLRFCHLTHIGLLLTTVTLFSGVIFRILEIKKRKALERPGKTKKGRNTLQENAAARRSRTAAVVAGSAFETAYIHLLSLTVTVECFILIVFWALWYADKQFVVKKENFEGDDAVSFFMNISMHGLPTFFMLVEFFLSEFQGSLWNYYLLSAFFLMYVLVMCFFYSETGRWPYPILNLLSARYRTAFLAYCLGMVLFLYALLAFFHRRVSIASWKKKAE